MADVGDLNVQIKADDKASATMRNVSANVGKAAGKMKTAMLGASAAIGGAFILQTKAFLDAGDELHKMNQRTLISVETLSALDHIAGLSGQQLSLFGVAAQMTEKLLLGLSEGAVKQTHAVTQLGLSYKDAQEMGFEKFMMELLFRIADVDDEITRGNIGVELFKGAWTNLKNVIGTMNGGELRELIDKEKETTFWTLENATAAADFNDAVANVQLQLKQLSFVMVEDYLPQMKDAIDKTLGFVKQNKEAILQTGRLAILFAKYTLIIYGTVKAIQLLIGVYRLFIATKLLSIKVFGLLKKAIIATRTAVIGLQIAAFAPFIIVIGIAAVAIGVLYAAFMIAWKNSEKFRKKVQDLVKWVKDLFNALKKFLIPEFKAYEEEAENVTESTKTTAEATKELEEQIKNSIYTAGNYTKSLESITKGLNATEAASDKVVKSYGDTIKKSAELQEAKRLIYGGLQVVNAEFGAHEGQVALTAEQYIKARMALEAWKKEMEDAANAAKNLGFGYDAGFLAGAPSMMGKQGLGEASRAFDIINAAKLGSEFGQQFEGNKSMNQAKNIWNTDQFQMRPTTIVKANPAEVAATDIQNKVTGRTTG